MRAGQTEKRDLPHEEGWMEFRTLSGRELDDAEEVQTRRGLMMVDGINLTALRASAEAQQRDQRDSYDKTTLIKYGVVGCSECEPCSDEAKQALDAQTRNWAVSVILEMNVRPLAIDSDSEPNSSTANSHRSSESLTAST